MKKLLGLVAAALCSAVVLSLLGCNGCSDPKFTGRATWLAKDDVFDTFRETAEYDVIWTGTYNENGRNYSKSEDVDESSFKYTDGKYVVTVDCGHGAEELPEAAKSYAAEKTGGEKRLYRISSEFSITATYKFGESEYPFHDKITSVVWFDAIGQSLRPYYSYKTYDSTTPSGDTISRYVYSAEVVWNKRASLKITDMSETAEKIYEGDEHYTLRAVNNFEKTVKFDDGAVLDNEQLLFAVRAVLGDVTIADDGKNYTQSIKILDTAYRSVQTLNLSFKGGTVSIPWSLKVGDEEPVVHEDSTSAYYTEIVNNNATYSGNPTICYYQTYKKGTDRGWLLRMITKLSGGCGALDYRLKSVTVSN